MLYRLYGLVVASEELLLGVPSVEQAGVDILVRRRSFQKPLPSLLNWFMYWHSPGGELWLSCAKMDGGYLLRFNELADFFISDEGREIVYIPKPETPPVTVKHLLLDQVIPLVINLKGKEVLHVSAILTPQGIVAFAGKTGSGKSTIAGSLVNVGYPFVSDDCLALIEKDGNIYGVPAYPGLRLWDDAIKYLFKDNGTYESVAHYTDKHRVDLGKKPEVYCKQLQPIRWLYIISDPSEIEGETDITINRLSPRESFMELVRCAFRLDITDQNMLKRQFRFLEKVVSKVSVSRLIYPRDFNLLPAVREAILDDLKKHG